MGERACEYDAKVIKFLLYIGRVVGRSSILRWRPQTCCGQRSGRTFLATAAFVTPLSRSGVMMELLSIAIFVGGAACMVAIWWMVIRG